MKRVLVISYYWPPSGGSGVQRWVKFSKYLPAKGWQPVVYTPLDPELIAVDESLAAEIPEEVEVIKRKIVEPYAFYRKLFHKGSAQSGEVNPVNSSKKSFGAKLSMWIRGNLFLPDPRCLWIAPSVRFLKDYLKAHPVDAIVSTGPPHSMHIIARKVAKATGIPWVADFRDPWTRMFYFKHLSLTPLSERIHRKMEKKVLDGATVIVSVSPLVRKEFETMTTTPVELITNGYDRIDFSAPEKDGFFNITHTGLFASDGIPDTLWKVLASKAEEDPEFGRKLRIRLVGKTDRQVLESIKAAGLEANLVDLGYLPHKEAAAEQAGASVLLLPLRKEPEYRAVLPGKLFEYLASGNPILGVGEPEGAMAAIVKDTSTGEVYDWDDAEGLGNFIDRIYSGDFVYAPNNIERYSREGLAEAMAALLTRITE